MPRRRLQIRLLTIVLLTLAAGILLQINLRIRGESRVLDWSQVTDRWFVLFQISEAKRGWPWSYWINDPPKYPRVYQGTYDPAHNTMPLDDLTNRELANFKGRWLYGGLAGDIAVALAILACLGILIEVFLARTSKSRSNETGDQHR